MTTDRILSTKLAIPTSQSQTVERPRLLLPEMAPRIVLVCAPAGYGKTTLISSWARSHQTPSSWLSLDTEDNDPTRFGMHFIAAIQTCHAGFGSVVSDMLGCTPPPPLAGLMRSLVNQLCGLPQRLCLILDDLHLITEPSVYEAIAFLADHQPPQLQLILSSRSEPLFSLARLRGQRQLLEYRAADLRFTLQETQSFCNEVMHFHLPDNQVAALTNRTEGWIVGLQLAAVSLLRATDKTGFIENFSGDNRHITDFLLDEVLQSRPQEFQNFLLQTSLLTRFNARLCDAVTRRSDSREMIDEMERSNMFIVNLDQQRLWYRYHHLFTALLQSRLQQLYPELVNTLHRRASQWFCDNKLISEAINHAILASDFIFAAELMEKHGGSLFSHGRISTVLAWSDQLPAEVLAQRPMLSILCAWGSYYTDNMPALDRHIRTAAQSLAGAQDAPFGSKNRTMFGQLAIMRGCHLGYMGNFDGAIAQFKDALLSIPEERTLHRAAAVSLGVCYLVARRLDEAQKLLAEHANISEVKYNLMVPITAILALARLHLLKGDLPLAKQIYDKAMQDCLAAGWQDFPACGMLHIGLGELAYEMNDLALAEHHLQRGIDMTSIGMDCQNAWGIALLAQTRMAQGKSEGILCPRSEAQLLKYSGRFVIDLAPASAATGKLWLLQGRLGAASQWAARAQLPTDGELSIGREAEYLVLARYLIASQSLASATNLLAKLWLPALQGKRLYVMIEILILQAIAFRAEAMEKEAIASLKQAVELASDTALLRIFINDSAHIANLLKNLARSVDHPLHVHFLLDQMTGESAGGKIVEENLAATIFSKKEKQVVSYLVSDRSNQEIAEALFISHNTLNSHVKRIYSKLGVKSRLQAAERLRKLGWS